MRSISTLHPSESIPVEPDTVQTLLVAAATPQALDWVTSTGGAAATAGAAGVEIVRLSGVSTAGAQINFTVNLMSTGAINPSTGTSIGTTSVGVNKLVMGQGAFQVPSYSTGWSVALLSSGYIQCEQWSK